MAVQLSDLHNPLDVDIPEMGSAAELIATVKTIRDLKAVSCISNAFIDHHRECNVRSLLLIRLEAIVDSIEGLRLESTCQTALPKIPDWLQSGLAKLEKDHERHFEPVMRRVVVNDSCYNRTIVVKDASDKTFEIVPFIRCLDCSAQLYECGIGESARMFEDLHISMNDLHIARAHRRLQKKYRDK